MAPALVRADATCSWRELQVHQADQEQLVVDKIITCFLFKMNSWIWIYKSLLDFENQEVAAANCSLKPQNRNSVKEKHGIL